MCARKKRGKKSYVGSRHFHLTKPIFRIRLYFVSGINPIDCEKKKILGYRDPKTRINVLEAVKIGIIPVTENIFLRLTGKKI